MQNLIEKLCDDIFNIYGLGSLGLSDSQEAEIRAALLQAASEAGWRVSLDGAYRHALSNLDFEIRK